MKKLLFIFFPILFFDCSSKNYSNAINEISNVEIKYNNGQIINGKLGFPIFLNQDYLYFKSFENGKIKINIDEVREITYRLPQNNIVFSKMIIIGKEISTKTINSQFLQVVSKGKINLYHAYNLGFLYEKSNKKFLQKTDLYFCRKENEENLALIYYVDNSSNNEKSIKKNALEFFSSIPEFEKSLNDTNFNPEFLIKFVNKYNNDNK